jgi:crossover junction endodeoxyribonuclease rusA superfamily|nr:MAG TPA: Endodeoxyribonuclease RusA [Caudoviricetes sp.]
MVEIVFRGRPITKKNHGQLVKRNGKMCMIPSKAYREYEESCLWQIAGKKINVPGVVVVECVYYMPDKKSFPDLIGLLQATSDILTKARVIDDDKWICSYGASRIAGYDKANPRAEITITNGHSEALNALKK